MQSPLRERGSLFDRSLLCYAIVPTDCDGLVSRTVVGGLSLLLEDGLLAMLLQVGFDLREDQISPDEQGIDLSCAQESTH